MAYCKDCVHFPVCQKHVAIVDFPVDDGVCLHFATSEELRPKGRWEMRGGKLYCTHCGERAAVARDSDDFWYTKGTPACPHCGAKMEVT